MKEDNYHTKTDEPCPKCNSHKTWYIDIVPQGWPDVKDVALYCEDCKGEFV